MLLNFLQSCIFFFFKLQLLRCLLSFNLSSLLPVLNGVITKWSVLVFVAWLHFCLLCWGFHTFVMPGVSLLPPAVYPPACSLMFWFWRFGMAFIWHLSMQYAHVFFPWAASEDELGSSVSSFKVILSCFLLICISMLWLHIISENQKASSSLPKSWMSHFCIV